MNSKSLSLSCRNEKEKPPMLFKSVGGGFAKETAKGKHYLSTCQMSHVTCHVSLVMCHVYIFFLFVGQSCEVCRWRVC